MTDSIRRISVVQDGRDFYCDSTGDLLFQSSLLVPDGDEDSALAARQEFCDWCEREELNVTILGA